MLFTTCLMHDVQPTDLCNEGLTHKLCVFLSSFIHEYPGCVLLEAVRIGTELLETVVLTEKGLAPCTENSWP